MTSSEPVVQVSHLTPGDGDAAVRVLASAFWTYPETLHLLPDAVARRHVLPRYLTSDVRDASSHGMVDVARVGDEIIGAAVWLPPRAYPIGPVRQLTEAVRVAPVAPWGFRALAEARRGQAANRAAHRAFPPHHWLRTLGVQPSHHGRGAGSALLRVGLERADHDGTGAFLFTATAANAAWYAEFGFDVATEYRPTPTWPTTWAMWRPPSSAAA